MLNVIYLSQALLFKLKRFSCFLFFASMLFFTFGGFNNYNPIFSKIHIFWILSVPTMLFFVVVFSISRVKDFEIRNTAKAKNAAIFYGGMMLLMLLFLYKYVVGVVVGVFIWDFSPELSGFSFDAIAHAQAMFLKNKSPANLIALYSFILAWGAVFFAGNEYFKKILRRR